MTSSILDNPASVNGITTPFNAFNGQTVVNEFFDVFSMFWKYILVIVALVCFLYRYTVHSSPKTKKSMFGG